MKNIVKGDSGTDGCFRLFQYTSFLSIVVFNIVGT